MNQALLKELEADQYLLAQKETMHAPNKGCDPKDAIKMSKRIVKADGNCLFNSVCLAMEGVVNKPDEIRQLAVSIMSS